MKKCPNCNQLFSDENAFCLNDGTPLMMLASTQDTVVLPKSSSGQQFQNRAEVAGKPGQSILIYLMFGVILLLSIVAVGFGVAFFMSSRGDNPKDTTAQTNQAANPPGSNPPSNQSGPARPSPTDAVVIGSPPPVKTVRPPGARSGLVIKPPSNVRFTPNGEIQCTVRSRSTINIYGDTGVYDNNGLWYYTDVCGRQGVIHSSQFKLLE
ncbi:MAG: hypothetical protein ACKVRN_04745 [Pyrinomonadaceae bacterium]